MNEQLGPNTLFLTLSIPESKTRFVYDFMKLFWPECPEAHAEGISKAKSCATRWKCSARNYTLVVDVFNQMVNFILVYLFQFDKPEGSRFDKPDFEHEFTQEFLQKMRDYMEQNHGKKHKAPFQADINGKIAPILKGRY